MSAESIRDRRRYARLVSVVVALVALVALAGPASAGVFDPPSQLAFVQQPTSSTAGEVISPAVTVVAKNSQGQVAPRYTGVITLALQGAGTLFGTKSKAAVGGVATFTDLAVNPAGSYTLVATAPKLPPATSDAFSITGFAEDCDAGICSESTGNIENPTPQDTIVGVVTVSTGACGAATCFMSVDETPGDICGGPCKGNAIKFIPPSNATGILVAEWGCDKSLCQGTGVANFHIFLEKPDLTPFELFDCPNPGPDTEDLPCIQKRSRTGVGDLLMTIWFNADGDPRYAGA